MSCSAIGLPLPIFAAPLGSIDLHYGPKYKDHAYNSILVKAAAEYGVMALTGDGVDPTIMLSSVEDMKKVGGIGCPVIKALEQGGRV